MALETYRRKRDFGTTPEPRGGRPARRTSRLRYVIHQHAATRLHYDLRLEWEGVLRSWAVPKGPSLDPREKRLAVQVEDHPMEYGTFEGIIPEGYGAGAVIVWDRGTWTPLEDAASGFRKGRLTFALAGEKLRGTWNLIRMRGRQDEGKTAWLLIKADDEAARTGRDVLADRPESVKSGRTIEDLKAGRKARASRDRDAPRRSQATRVRRGASRHSPAGSRPAPARARASVNRIPGARPAEIPAIIRPQLATLVSAAPEGDEWFHEIKFDGYRMLARLVDGDVRLITRSGLDWTARFPAVAEALPAVPARQALLDGEIVVLEPDGTTRFQSLQNVLRLGHGDSLVYYVFDLLHLNGYDLGGSPLETRKQVLAGRLSGLPANGRIRYSDHVAGGGGAFHAMACERRLEGIVSKRRDSTYHAGVRTRDWVKVKCSMRQELVIGGWTEPRGSREALGALLLGVRENGSLRYAGRVGTGFDQETLRDLLRRLRRLESPASPFADAPASRGVHWVRPRLVAEIAFTGWTDDRRVRHPSFQGLREDKPAREVRRERPEPPPSRGARRGNVHRRARARKGPPVREPGHDPPEGDPEPEAPPQVEPLTPPPAGDPPDERPPVREPSPVEEPETMGQRLTHPGKVLFPEMGLTKLDLARYWIAVADEALPALAGRPLMLLRCPEGRGRTCFFQKHPTGPLPAGLSAVRVREKKGTDSYAVVKDRRGLVALVQQGVLEIHVWGSRADRLEQPDRMVFDIDPDPQTPWPRVVGAAQGVRARLESFDLDSFLKTTGGKGLHVVVPLRRGPGWEDVRAFSAAVASELVREDPALWTTQLSKAKRGGRIFLDTLRNGRGATWVAAYSPRAREGAPVSMPIAWSELGERLDPGRFTVASVPTLLRQRAKDPWAGLGTTRQTLRASLLRQVIERSSRARR